MPFPFDEDMWNPKCWFLVRDAGSRTPVTGALISSSIDSSILFMIPLRA